VGAGSEQADVDLEQSFGVTDKEVMELSNLTGLTGLSLGGCGDVSSEGLQTLSNLTGRGAACCKQPHQAHHPLPSMLPQRDQ
jgi:hypothetical protein